MVATLLPRVAVMSIELLADAMKFDAVARRERRSDPALAALPDNVIAFPLASALAGRRRTTAAAAVPTSALVLRLAQATAPDERQELRSLLGGLERFELPGDVGRMVYLALENAADERAQAATVHAPGMDRDHVLKRAARRVLRALRRASRRRRAVQPG